MNILHQPSLDALVQPLAGLFQRVVRIPINPGDPRFSVMTAELNDIGQVLDNAKISLSGDTVRGTLNGAGNGLVEEDARLKAIAEGLERYCSCVYHESQFLQATAEELGATALDLDTLARCSEQEIAHPRCPLRLPDKKSSIRWVRGISLSDGSLIWLPAVMVYMYIPYQNDGECFWFPTSTGCAAHRSYEEALLGAICEVIERDAISLTWLQQLQLPRLELDVLDAQLQDALQCQQHSSMNVETIFFDATTDLGIPTIYSLQTTPHNKMFASLVMCSTGLDPALCVTKVLSESSASRIGLQSRLNNQSGPQKSPDDFIDVMDGALYMAHPSRLEAFNFLRNTPVRRRLSQLPIFTSGDTTRDLRRLVEHLQTCGLHIFAVDLTTDEALRVGMYVVRVIIPELQPLSFSYKARFLAHPRLYLAPQKMGRPVLTEAQINPWPQPFA